MFVSIEVMYVNAVFISDAMLAPANKAARQALMDLRVRGTGQVFQDRTVRPLIAVAAMDQVRQRIAHFLHRFDAVGQAVRVSLCDALHAGTCAPTIAPQAHEFGDFQHRKA